MAVGTASAVDTVAEATPSHRLVRSADWKSSSLMSERNQRNEKCCVGIDRKLSGVKATRHTTTSGARMKTRNSPWNASAPKPLRSY